MKTRLQFDETAKHLQNLETATRKAVCATVKEFNKMGKEISTQVQETQRVPNRINPCMDFQGVF